MFTEPITRALEDLYWSKRIAADSSLSSTLAMKRMLVKEALEDYANDIGSLLTGMLHACTNRRHFPFINFIASPIIIDMLVFNNVCSNSCAHTLAYI